MRQLSSALTALGLVALLACGGEESTAPDAPPVDAGPPTTEAAPPASPSDPAAAPAALTPEAEGCLALVRDARYAEAVPICTRALEARPDDAQVQAALEEARQASADKMAQEAEEAAEGAREKASDEAGKAASDATRDLLGD